MSRRSRFVAASVVTFVLAGGAVAARADEPAPAPKDSEKEALAKRVEDLERKIEELNRKLESSGANQAGDELEARVAELEKLSRKDENGLFGYWKNGIRFDSANGAFKLRLGGRVQNDWAWFAKNQDIEDATGKEVEAGTEFRRARLGVGGTIYRNVEFMGEYDFANGGVKARDVWIGLHPCGTGFVQVGSMKEPFGLEEQTSDLFTTFMERSSGNEAFAPSYNTGAMYSDTLAEERVAWAAGIFRDANDAGDDTGNTNSGEYNYTGRVTGRPWIGESPDKWVHVGVGASRREPSNDALTYKSRPEMHLAPILVNTDTFDASGNAIPMDAGRAMLYEGEAAFSMGPFWTSAEYFLTDVRLQDASDPTFNAWNVQAGFFLTGESRPYNARKGVFDRVSPKKNFDDAGGAGAWEVAARYDSLDLNDADVNGGELKILTVGANWYLNPNTKVQIAWVHSHTYDVGRLDGLEMRFQVDF